MLALVLAAAGIVYGLIKPAPPRSTALGRVAPEFSLERLDGKGRVTSDDLTGSPLVINFWASWCIPCAEEMPRFQKAWENYEDDGVVILGVDLRDAPDSAKDFVRKYGVTYPVVTDPDEKLSRAMHVFDLPQTFFVGRDWRFQAVGGGAEGDKLGTVVLGAISEELLNDEIEQLLEDGG